MSKFKKTGFNERWLLDNKFSPWLRPVEKDHHAAYCLFCKTTFALSNMGKRAVTSHAEGKKHMLAVNSRCQVLPIKSFFTPNANRPTDIENQVKQTVRHSEEKCIDLAGTSSQIGPLALNDCTAADKPNLLKKFVQMEEVLKAEIIWCIDTVLQHRSIRSSERTAELFVKMFPDSDIAKKMQLKRTKIGYLIVFGIAPYFKNELIKCIRDSPFVVLGFDESLNKVAQKGQMDIFVRFCQNNEVSSRYFNSTFLGHSTAEDILEAFLKAIEGVDHKKILQISMDGPNVNKKFFRLLREKLATHEDSTRVITIGSCGLHTMNNAFKAGIKKTGWDLVEILRALHNLFNRIPSRRADYTHYSNSTKFPAKYCAVRWLENSSVAKTALDILPNIILYVDGIKNDKKEPTCKSFTVVQEAIKDKLLKGKLAFFQSLASDLEPFLRAFQSDKPLTPFLFDSLQRTLKVVMLRFVKKEVLEQSDLSKIDLNRSESLKSYKEIDLGYGTREALSKSGKLKDIEIQKFRKDCRDALVTACSKLQESSPLQFKLTKGLSFLNPEVMVIGELKERRLKIVLENFVENRWLTGTIADKLHREVMEVSEKPVVVERLKNFDWETDRLDKLWLCDLDKIANLSTDLKRFLNMIFCFSHGNAAAERGFSINKECLVENQKEMSLIAQRIVFDSVSNIGGLNNIEISKTLIHHAKNARARYHENLEMSKKEKLEEEETMRNKRQASQKFKELTEKKLKIMEEAQRNVDALEAEMYLLKK